MLVCGGVEGTSQISPLCDSCGSKHFPFPSGVTLIPPPPPPDSIRVPKDSAAVQISSKHTTTQANRGKLWRRGEDRLR